jgi:hypothetical protein
MGNICIDSSGSEMLDTTNEKPQANPSSRFALQAQKPFPSRLSTCLQYLLQ